MRQTRYTQTIVAEPTFRRGLASIIDIRGRLGRTVSIGSVQDRNGAAQALLRDRDRIRDDAERVGVSRRRGSEADLVRAIRALRKEYSG
jgi:hypothetical protein